MVWHTESNLLQASQRRALLSGDGLPNSLPNSTDFYQQVAGSVFDLMLLSAIDPEIQEGIFNELYQGGQMEYNPDQGVDRKEWFDAIEEKISVSGAESDELGPTRRKIQAKLIMDPRVEGLSSSDREILFKGMSKWFASAESAEFAITGALAFLFKGVLYRQDNSLADLERMIDTAKAQAMFNPPSDISDQDKMERDVYLTEWLSRFDDLSADENS